MVAALLGAGQLEMFAQLIGMAVVPVSKELQRLRTVTVKPIFASTGTSRHPGTLPSRASAAGGVAVIATDAAPPIKTPRREVRNRRVHAYRPLLPLSWRRPRSSGHALSLHSSGAKNDPERFETIKVPDTPESDAAGHDIRSCQIIPPVRG